MTTVKWTIVNGEWVQVPAILIDPKHPYATGDKARPALNGVVPK